MKLKFFTHYIQKSIDDLFDTLVYPICEGNYGKEIEEYYFIFDNNVLLKKRKRLFNFDKNGIPLFQFNNTFFYSPITIGQYGLGIFHTWLKNKNNNDKEKFVRIAKWYLSNYTTQNNDSIVWKTDVDIPPFKIPRGWISAMAQGRACSILLRYHQLSHDNAILPICEKAIKTFLIPVNRGGVYSKFRNLIFYEEYAHIHSPHVLNGMIFALFGVHEYFRYTEDNKAKQIFENGIETLIKAVKWYDVDFWTRYDLFAEEINDNRYFNIATVHYQFIHVNQMKVLYKITNEKIFKQMAEKWEQQITFFNKLKAHLFKLKKIIQVGGSLTKIK